MNFLKQYITIGRFETDEVFPHLTDNKRDKKVFKVNNIEYLVKMNSLRYKVFQQNLNCAICNIKGSYFLLQKSRLEEVFHFNLYAEDSLKMNDGEIILMTKDHIVPKSKGGKDIISNLQTMCAICNTLKASQ